MLFNTGKEKDIPNVPVYVLEKGAENKLPDYNIISIGQILFINNIQNEGLVNGLGNTQSPLILEYEVEKDSTITLPVLGKTKIAGLTITSAENKINTLYKENLLKDPMFKIKISNMKVTLLGEFVTQGNFYLSREKISLIEMIGEAKGLNMRANKKRLKIIRGDLNHPEVLLVDLTDIKSLADPRLNLRDHDILYLEPKSIISFSDNLGPFISYVGIGTAIVNILFLISRN